jgi:hypothetical protein
MTKKNVTKLVNIIFMTGYVLIILYFGIPTINRMQSERVSIQIDSEVISDK